MRRFFRKLFAFVGVIGAMCFFAFIVCASQKDPAGYADYHLKEHTVQDGPYAGYTEIYGTIESGYTLKDLTLKIGYYPPKTNQLEYVDVHFGTVEKGTTEVRVVIDILGENFHNEKEGYGPNIYEKHSSSRPYRLPKWLFLGGAILCFAIVFIALMRNAKKTTYRDTPHTVEVFDGYGAAGGDDTAVDCVAPPSKRLFDKATRVHTDTPRTQQEKFDALEYAAMTTVNTRAAERYFFEDVHFYDEVRSELLATGKYKVYDDAEKNDFLFCCDMVRTEASWEDMLRVVCYDCYDELTESEAKAVDKGTDAKLAEVIDRYKATDESRKHCFYAVYDRLHGDTCAERWNEFVSIAGAGERVEIEAVETQPTPEVAATPAAPAIPVPVVPTTREETPQAPTKETAAAPVRRKAFAFIAENEAAVIELLADYQTVKRVRVQWENERTFPDDVELLSTLDPDDFRLFIATARNRMAQNFLDRLDKKSMKAFRKATLAEKAEIFRDMPSADRPEVEEGFFYAVYDDLGGTDEDVKRERFERLIAGRFE